MWRYTPRQIAGFIDLAHRRKMGEAASALAIGINASRGKPDEVKKTINKWSRESE